MQICGLYLIPIPEPSTRLRQAYGGQAWIGDALALGAIGLMSRKRGQALASYPPRRIRPLANWLVVIGDAETEAGALSKARPEIRSQRAD